MKNSITRCSFLFFHPIYKNLKILFSHFQLNFFFFTLYFFFIPIMQIKVKNVSGREIDVDIDASETIKALKLKLEEKEGVAPEQQKIIFKGKNVYQTSQSLHQAHHHHILMNHYSNGTNVSIIYPQQTSCFPFSDFFLFCFFRLIH